MIKVQQKVSGCFRGFTSSKEFLLMRGYVETPRKNEKGVFDGLIASIIGHVPTLALITEPE